MEESKNKIFYYMSHDTDDVYVYEIYALVEHSFTLTVTTHKDTQFKNTFFGFHGSSNSLYKMREPKTPY